MPNQNPRKPFPAWRLINGVKNASDGDLEASADSCEHWSWYFGGLVAFGLVVEVILGVLHPSYDSVWSRWGSTLANALIFIGVAGEVQFSRMGFRRDHEIKRRSDEKVAKAIERASEANRIAEGERLRRVEIEAKLASRRLTTEQSSKLTSALCAVKAQIPELQLSRLGNREARDFANDILKCVEDSGILYEVADIETLEFLKPHGLTLSDTPDGLLRAAFESAGITISDSANTNARPIIFVGLKPPPF